MNYWIKVRIPTDDCDHHWHRRGDASICFKCNTVKIHTSQ